MARVIPSNKIGMLLLLMFFMAGGCTHETIVNQPYTSMMGFEEGGIYELTEDVFVLKDTDKNKTLYLRSQEKLGITSNEWLNNPKSRHEIIAVLSANTELMYTHILLRENYEIGSIYYPMARVLDGPLKGATVNIGLLSKNESLSRNTTGTTRDGSLLRFVGVSSTQASSDGNGR